VRVGSVGESAQVGREGGEDFCRYVLCFGAD